MADPTMPNDPNEPDEPSMPPCLVLYGTCGMLDPWDEDGFTAKQVVDFLAANKSASEIEVRISSGGGVADQGTAIFNLLREFSGKVTVKIDGIAGSAASLIAMAGDNRVIGQGALFFIHNAWNICIGDANDMRKTANVLDTISGQYVNIYSDRSGQKKADVKAMMDAESWLPADEAVKLGFCTAVAGEADAKALASVRLDFLDLKKPLPARLLAARERHPELVPAARAAGAIRPRTLAPGEMLAEAAPPTTTTTIRTITASAARQIAALAEGPEAITAAPAVDEPAADPGPESEAAAPAVAEVNAENPMTTAEASAAKNAEILALQATDIAAAKAEADLVKAELATMKAERDEEKRCAEIRRMSGRAKLDGMAETLIADKTVTVAQAQAALFDALATKQEAEQGKQAGSHVRVEGGADAAEKFAKGAEAWLIRRSEARVAKAVAAHAAASGKPADLDPGEFRGMTLMDIARASLEASGQRVSGFDKRRIVSQAFTMRPQGAIVQGTGDFPTLLENVMHKVMQAAYGTTPDTWREFCNVGTLTDFRPHNRYRTGSFGVLDLVLENGEYKQKAIPDGEKATISGLTKGNIYALSRQAIINDDMNALTGVAASAGRAAKLSIEVDIYALLALNAGLGPTMPDGLTLFHASHNNLGTTGAPSVTTFDEVNQLIGKQRDVTGNEVLDLRPSIWVGPRSYGMTARIVNEAQFDPSVSNKFQLPNGVRGIFSRIVDTSRLTSTRWYAFSDPASAPTLEVAFLDGVQEPFLDNETGWNVDGVEWKVRLDYGYAAIDYRGAVTNG